MRRKRQKTFMESLRGLYFEAIYRDRHAMPLLKHYGKRRPDTFQGKIYLWICLQARS